MRTFCLLTLLACALAATPSVRADDEPSKKAPPAEIVETLKRVISAVTGDDQAALTKAANDNSADEWLLADWLLATGRTDMATRYAAAMDNPRTTQLAAYVKTRIATPTPAAARKTLTNMQAAINGGDPKGSLKMQIDAAVPLDTVTGIRVAHAGGLAMLGTRRLKEGQGAFTVAAEAADAMGWKTRALLLYHWAGLAAAQQGMLGQAQPLWEKRLVVAEAIGDKRNAAITLTNLGMLASQRGDLKNALVFLERSLPIIKSNGDPIATAQAMNTIATTRARLGDYDAAQALLEKALVLAAKNADVARSISSNLGTIFSSTGEFKKARPLFEKNLKASKKSGDLDSQARALSSLARLDEAQGKLVKSMRRRTQALTLFEKLGDVNSAAGTHLNIGGGYFGTGNYASALAHMESALAGYEKAGSYAGVGKTLARLGVVYSHIGESAKAISLQERAFKMQRDAGDNPSATSTANFLGSAYGLAGDAEKALEYLHLALELAANSKDAYPRGKAHQLIGSVYRGQGDHARALASHEKALAIFDEAGQRTEWAQTIGEVGRDLMALDRPDEALEKLERGAREARRMRASAHHAGLLQEIALVHLNAGHPDRALAAAQTALQELEGVLGGLDERSASGARATYAQLYEVGTLAAVEADNPEDALLFLESGRAGALLESLEIGQEQRWEGLPEELREAEEAAIADVGRARRAYEKARRRKKRKDAQEALKAVDAALEKHRDLVSRIQREAKKQAGMFYPRVAPLEEIQEAVEEDEALVVYGLCLNRALAFVITQDDARIVKLGSSEAILKASAALTLDEPTTEHAEALSALRDLLITPLKLGTDVKTLLVSPPGALCYVPWGTIAERPVAIAASGTTHALLESGEREKGEGVLALGDPQYAKAGAGTKNVYHRGSALTPLPATRVEAQAVGSVVLLAAEATRDGLVSAMAKNERWRAIHLACHGLVDLERPTLSSLALSPTKEHDGFLPVLDVLRMTIPADLAVLSACETGQGQVVRGEGIVGLTRAFMYAGPPRVLCSLWKVDDEATRALMVKFYELWNPKEGEGISAAAALRQAQAHVRAQEKWKHPYYWGAWVLWGLPK